MFLLALRAMRPATGEADDLQDRLLIPELHAQLAELAGVEHIRIVPRPSCIDVAVFYRIVPSDDWESPTDITAAASAVVGDVLPGWSLTTD